jgi:hypothetical protein
MILDILFYIFSFILGTLAAASNLLARGFSIWPDKLLEGLTYFFTCIMKLDMILNIVALFTVLKWFLGFLVIYYSVKLFIMLINALRGSGKVDI